MPYRQTEEGYEYDQAGDMHIFGSTVALANIDVNIAKKLYALRWSAAHIARYLNVTQEEVREMLDQ